MEIFQSSFHDQRKGTRACYPLIGSSEKDCHYTGFFQMKQNKKWLRHSYGIIPTNLKAKKDKNLNGSFLLIFRFKRL